MHFHICLATLPRKFLESVQDTILLIAAGLEDCGHTVTLDDAQVLYGGKTINLLLEHFDRDTAESVVATKRTKGRDFPLGLVLTENLLDANVMAGPFVSRRDNFRRVADVADFIWYFIPGTEAHDDIVDPSKCARFQVGHSHRFATVPVQKVRDIDFFLPGLTYPRRKPILEKLHERGYRVRSSDLATPAYIYRSLMGRAKAIIDIKRFDDTTNMSTVRVCNGASNGIAVVAEQFDVSELAEMYDYAVTADYENFVDVCIELVERGDPVAIGKANMERFIRERPLRPYVEQLLAATVFDSFRSAG